MMLPSYFASDGAALNLEHLGRMQASLDPDSFREIMDDYTRVLKVRLGDLRVRSASAEECSRITHDLVGISGTLGLTRLMLASEHLGHAARSAKSSSDLAAMVSETELAAGSALEALDDWLKSCEPRSP